jgi:N-acetylneuraminate epimerase
MISPPRVPDASRAAGCAAGISLGDPHSLFLKLAFRFAAFLAIVNMSFIPAFSASAEVIWKSLPAIPDNEGFAGSYAGESGGVLIVAGGANFPDRRPWEGGAKIWYDRVFALVPGERQWRRAGTLPCVAGYGASVSLEDGVLLIGGGDAKRNFNDVWFARWDGREVRFEAWPRLPRPLAMCAAARAGHIVYVAGGIERPDATVAARSFYALNLNQRQAGWRELPGWPGAERLLAIAGGAGDDFYLFSGARLVEGPDGKAARQWLRDAFRFSPGRGWTEIAPLPRVAVAAPTPAPLVDGRLLVIGGDDGAQAAVAPTEHQGFPRDVLAYDPALNAWIRKPAVPFGLVTTTLVIGQRRIVVAGGEQRPGVRSTSVWAAELP